MDEVFIKEIAGQLKKPEGKLGREVADRMNESNRLMNLKTIEALNLKERHHILEIGMGNGGFISEIFKTEDRITYSGVDYSEDMVFQATEKNKLLMDTGAVEFQLGTADALSAKDESVDTIFTVNTLYFWENYSKVLNEFKRVLKKDGQLIITIRPEHVMHYYPPTQFGFNHFSKETLGALLEKNGFQIKQQFQDKEPEIEINGIFFHPEYLITIASKN